MNKTYFEVFVCGYSEAHLNFIYHVVKHSRWGKYIDNLTLDVVYDERLDENKVRVSGWATKKRWGEFCNKVINDTSLDYCYEG